MSEFYDALILLRKIRHALGDRGLVGIGLDDKTLVVTHAIPGTGMPMWVMKFDGPDDYSMDASDLIAEFAKSSAGHFVPHQQQQRMRREKDRSLQMRIDGRSL